MNWHIAWPQRLCDEARVLDHIYRYEEKKYKEKQMIVGSSILVDGYDCLLVDCSHGVFTWALGGSCSKSYAHTVTTRCHGYRSTLRVAIKELEMKAQKKDVVQFEMGTGPGSLTQRSLSPQSLILEGYDEWERDNLKPDTQYAVRMVAVPDGYRVATYEEAEACTAAMSFTRDGWAPFHRSGGIRMNELFQFVVPKETEEDRKKRKIMDRIEAAEKELAAAKAEIIKGE